MATPHDALVPLLAAGADALRRGNPKQAVAKAQEVLNLKSDSGEALLILGVAESQLGRKDLATTHLRRAVQLMPGQPQARFNLAVHLQNISDPTWRTEAESVLEQSPDHEGTRRLLGRPVEAVTPDRPYAPGPFTYMGGQDDATHSLRFMEGREKAWQISGWCLVVLAVGVTVSLRLHPPFEMPDMSPKGRLAGPPKSDLLSMYIIAYTIAIGIATYTYMIADMLDRRARFLWLVPLTACCFLGVPAAPLALYLAMGRR